MGSPWVSVGFSEFLSTPSARRATDKLHLEPILDVISIHALREEGDQHELKKRIAAKQFLSTPSARRATIPFRLFMSVQ